MTPTMAQAATLPANVYTNLAQIYGNAGTGGQYRSGGSTMGNIAQGAALGSTYLPGIWDNIFNGNGGDNNASANAYGSLVTSNPSSFGWGQAFF
jgi:hypothetical protein